jgi:hypothetical protein
VKRDSATTADTTVMRTSQISGSIPVRR